MRVLIAVLIAVSSVAAYDAVVFSNEQRITCGSSGRINVDFMMDNESVEITSFLKVTSRKDFPSFENLISTASSEAPLVFIVNPDFTLGQFSREAAAYSKTKELSGLPAMVKSAPYHASRYFADPLYAPGAVILLSADNFFPGPDIFILMGEEWASMQTMAEAVLSKLGDKYTAVITATEAVSGDKKRVKRIVTTLMDEADATGAPEKATGAYVDMPISLPPYNRTEYGTVKPTDPGLGSCLFYAEGVNIIVMNSKKSFATIPIRSDNATWSYGDGDVNCVNATVGDYKFYVRMRLKTDVNDDKKQVIIKSGSQVEFTLIFNAEKNGFWQLKDVAANSIFVEPYSSSNFISGKATAQEKVINSVSVQNVGMISVLGFGLACSDSQAAFFKTNEENVLIGISLYNTQVQPIGVSPDKKTNAMYFSRYVEDCVGTFSTGSWMAIISILIMLAGFIFGFMMLNSVQTMDRFDDPKHKQIVINVRE